MVEHVFELHVPVGDRVEREAHFYELVHNLLGLRVGLEKDPTLPRSDQYLRWRIEAQSASGLAGVLAPKLRQLLLGPVVYVLVYVLLQALPDQFAGLLDGQGAVLRVRRQILYKALDVHVYPEKRFVNIEENGVVAHFSIAPTQSCAWRADARQRRP